MWEGDDSANFVQVGWNGYVVTVSWSDISDQEIERLYELERDMWSHGLGQYIRCAICEKISSKSEVFGGMESCIKNETVSEIERILSLSHPPACPCCSWPTQYVFWEAYKDEIASRYRFPTSFVSLYKDMDHQIHGFMDGYISSIDTIYDREFDYYYSHTWKNTIVWKIETILSQTLPSELLCIPALWVHQEHASMLVIYHLMKDFFQKVSQYDPELIGIYESVLGTNTHSIYEICWGKRIHSWDHETFQNVKEGFEGDIFIHPNIGSFCIETLWESYKNFIRSNIRAMKEILENNT